MTQADEIRTRAWFVNQFAKTPDQPGGTRHVELASALSEAGWVATIVASDLNLVSRKYSRREDHRDRRPIQEASGEVTFVWLPAGTYESNDWRRGLSMITFSWNVVRFLSKRVDRTDVVVGSSPHLLAALAARLVAWRAGCGFVLELRDLWPESLIAVTGRRGFAARVLAPISRFLYRASTEIVILAEGSRPLVSPKVSKRTAITCVPNGVRLSDVVGPNDSSVPESLAWIWDTPVFVYAGAHGPANGLDLVLDTAAVLRRSRPDINILLLGDGTEKARLQRRAAEESLTNVVFHEPIPKAAMFGVLAACTGGLMILRQAELFAQAVSPNKLFDYLSVNLPVVSNVPGEVARTIEQAEAGVTVDPTDPGALARAMIMVADTRPLSRGREYIEAHHERTVLARDLDEVLRRSLRVKKP